MQVWSQDCTAASFNADSAAPSAEDRIASCRGNSSRIEEADFGARISMNVCSRCKITSAKMAHVIK